MSIIRRIRIGKLTGHYQEKDLEAMNFIQQVLERMVMKTNDKYPDTIYYCVDDKGYFQMGFDIQKRKNGYLYCRYGDFWEVLGNKYLLNYTDIKILMKSMLEQHLKCEVGTPSYDLPLVFHCWNNISNVR